MVMSLERYALERITAPTLAISAQDDGYDTYVQFKWPIGKPRVDHLRGPIWEVRTTLGNRIARTLFAVAHGQMVLLHGFIKKTQRTPIEKIDLAAKRFKEWRHGET